MQHSGLTLVVHDPLCPSDLVCNCGQVHRSYTCQCDIIAKVRADERSRMMTPMPSTDGMRDQHDHQCPGYLPERIAHAPFRCPSCDLIARVRASYGETDAHAG